MGALRIWNTGAWKMVSPMHEPLSVQDQSLALMQTNLSQLLLAIIYNPLTFTTSQAVSLSLNSLDDEA